MSELIPVLKQVEIQALVTKVAIKISSDYKNNNIVIIGVLKGAFIFLSDLIRQINIPLKVDFIAISSYGPNTFSSGKIRLTKKNEIDIKNQNVLIVEDIVDTGSTLSFIINYLTSFCPRSIKVCTLIDKQSSRKKRMKIDYACYVAKRGFFVGYGLDFAEDYRGLPDIYNLKL